MHNVQVQSGDNSISIDKMNDGDIGVITEWGNHRHLVGRVVQCVVDDKHCPSKYLLQLGRSFEGDRFSQVYTCLDRSNLRVRLLPWDITLIG